MDGQILNKPVDRDDAERMIRLQEGRDSDVLTAICLFHADRWGSGSARRSRTSVVRFRILTDRERRAYLDSNRWEGKAGAYGVQDRDPFVSVARGSLHNVVGLPLERLERLLEAYSGLTNQG